MQFTMLNNMYFANQTDDTTSYVTGYGAYKATDSLKNVSNDLFCCLGSNQIKKNPAKCHLIASCDNDMSISANNYNIANSK